MGRASQNAAGERERACQQAMIFDIERFSGSDIIISLYNHETTFGFSHLFGVELKSMMFVKEVGERVLL